MNKKQINILLKDGDLLPWGKYHGKDCTLIFFKADNYFLSEEVSETVHEIFAFYLEQYLEEDFFRRNRIKLQLKMLVSVRHKISYLDSQIQELIKTR